MSFYNTMTLNLWQLDVSLKPSCDPKKHFENAAAVKVSPETVSSVQNTLLEYIKSMYFT